MSLIDVKNLYYVADGQSILQDVSLHVDAGEIVTLIGPNGAGKSSLVRIMVGAIAPERGAVLRDSKLRLGYVPQKLETTALMPMRVSRFLRAWGRTSETRRHDIVHQYGLEPLLDQPLTALSGGEMRRVLFAHALLDDPNLLVLDEMTAGLDIAAAGRFYEYIEDLRQRENIAILMVSHDLNMVMRASDRVICLNGHICCQGAPLDVSQAPEYARTMGFVNPMAFYEHHHDHDH